MTDPIYEIKFACRVCKGSLDTVLKLGDHYLPGWPLPDEPDPPKAPLELTQCRTCGLVQLRHTVNRDLLYRDYWYESGVNSTMRMHLANIMAEANIRTPLKPRDVVLDIGANDGTLLSYYPPGLRCVGFDPASLVHDRTTKSLGTWRHYEGSDRPEWTHIQDFFSADGYFRVIKEKAKCITAIAMFYDLDDPNAFLQDVKQVLHPEGLFVLEMNTLPYLLQGAFDIIGHEHLTYWDGLGLYEVLAKHGLSIFDSSFSALNGGSQRLYARLGTPRSVASEETKRGNLEFYDFTRRLEQLKHATVGLLKDIQAEGKTIYVLGASTRGHTLLQYYGLDSRLIAKASDRNPRKHGRRIAGTGIPIISNEQMREEKPDYVLVLPWSFRDEILEREKELLEQGTRFIFPLPKLEIVDRETPLALTKER
ncbi:MAG: class I SAM-dependent methyltransferase [Candidatus Brocadiales bacterium]